MCKNIISVSKIINQYFEDDNFFKDNIYKKYRKRGMILHDLIRIYFINGFYNSLSYLLHDNNKEKSNITDITDITDITEKHIIKKMFNSFLNFVNSKRLNWVLMFSEENFFYKNIGCKPDVVYLKVVDDNYYKSFLFKNFNKILIGIKDKSIIDWDKIHSKKNNDASFIIVDLKTKNTNSNCFRIYKEKKSNDNKYDLFFHNTKFNRFCLQLNLYYFILENLGYKINELYVLVLDSNEFSYDIISIPFIKKEILYFIIYPFCIK